MPRPEANHEFQPHPPAHEEGETRENTDLKDYAEEMNLRFASLKYGELRGILG